MIDPYFINKLFQNNCFKSTNSYFKKNSTEIINSSFRIHPCFIVFDFSIPEDKSGILTFSGEIRKKIDSNLIETYVVSFRCRN